MMNINPVRAALLAVLDQPHADAVLEDREQLMAPLTLDEARTVAAWCDSYADPNRAAEILIGRRYRGVRGLTQPTGPAARSRAGDREAATHEDISRADEPLVFAKACELAGWGWKLGWKQARFPPAIAERARILVAAPGSRFRVVGGGK